MAHDKEPLLKLLDLVTTKSNDQTSTLEDFLLAQSLPEMLKQWLSLTALPSNIKTTKQALSMLSAEIAHIDQLLNQQINNILHHPEFQELEARWLGLNFLVTEAQPNKQVKICLLDITWQEIHKDATRLEFDQSNLFKKIYSDEFGTAGGEPFGVILGDYAPHLQGSKSLHDIDNLVALSSIATASFCPFIVGIAPDSFEANSFADINFAQNFEKYFNQPNYNRWNNFRKSFNSRFLGVVLPRILLRKPYHHKMSNDFDFYFDEDVDGLRQEKYLWGNGCFAFGLALIRSFNETSWFGNIRGMPSPDNNLSNGLMNQMPIASHRTDSSFADVKFATEVFIDEVDESLLSELGFIPLCTHKKTGHSLLYSNMSAYKITSSLYTSENDMKISAMLQYIMCASRFAHYIKIIGRDKIGTILDKDHLSKVLTAWIDRYIAKNEVNDKLRAMYPLQGAKVEVQDTPGKPGAYSCIIHLKPRYQLEKVSTALTLITELAEINNN